MPLSEKTLAEMHAGALAVAKHAGAEGIDPEYMDAMIRTQQRALFLKALAKDGKIRLEQQTRKHSSDKHVKTVMVVYVGKDTEPYEDPNAELTGAWPSEVLVARIALAVSSGVGLKVDDNA